MSCAGLAPIGFCTWRDAFRAGWTLQQVFDATKIDPWFLSQIEDLLREESLLRSQGFEGLDYARMRALKRKGFSDSRIASLVGRDEPAVRNRRRKLRPAPRIQARRHLRGGIRDDNRLPLFHLRGGVRSRIPPRAARS